MHPTDYFYEPVRYLACHGVISGYADGTFRPYNNTTRGADGQDRRARLRRSPIQTPATPTFTDVPPATRSTRSSRRRRRNSIVSGYAGSRHLPALQTPT